MLARLRQLSPSTGELDVTPPTPPWDPFPRHEPGWRSRSPLGAATPYPGVPRGGGGAEDEDEEEEEGAAERVRVRLLRRGCCIVAAGTPPSRRRASPGLPGHCPAGNSRWQRALTRPGAPWGAEGRGTRGDFCWMCSPSARGGSAPHTAQEQDWNRGRRATKVLRR